MNKLRRSNSFIKVLQKAKTRQRTGLLKKFPKFVVNDIAEIIHNILLGNVKISNKQRTRLKQNRAKLMDIMKASHRLRPALIYKETGGSLFTMLLPLIASVISSIISSRND